jgi:hypothetical protein
VVYGWDYINDDVRAQAAQGLTRAGMLEFLEFMAAAILNPWEIGLQPGETRELNMPNLAFGAGGMASILIDDFGLMLWVTNVTWTSADAD